MKKNNIAIATISWARNEEEENLLRASLQQLSALNLPVYITDGGSSDSFLQFLHALPMFTIYQAKGLWPQAKNSLLQARAGGGEFIFYTEPDKLDFFRDHLPSFLEGPDLDGTDGVLLASRSAQGFASFPTFQQMTETTINHCCKEVMGKEVDYCYGPFLFNSRLTSSLDGLPQTCGWGWRPFLFAVAHRLGLRIGAFEGDFACPPEQREEEQGERIYRMKQLIQNIEGLLLATSVQLP